MKDRIAQLNRYIAWLWDYAHRLLHNYNIVRAQLAERDRRIAELEAELRTLHDVREISGARRETQQKASSAIEAILKKSMEMLKKPPPGDRPDEIDDTLAWAKAGKDAARQVYAGGMPSDKTPADMPRDLEAQRLEAMGKLMEATEQASRVPALLDRIAELDGLLSQAPTERPRLAAVPDEGNPFDGAEAELEDALSELPMPPEAAEPE